MTTSHDAARPPRQQGVRSVPATHEQVWPATLSRLRFSPSASFSKPPEVAWPTLRDWKALIPMIAASAIAYVVAGKFGLTLAFVNASATPVWPPTGIALAAVLLLGYRVWPGVLIGAFVVNMTTAGSAASSLGIAIGNTLEALVGAALVTRFANGTRAFERPQDLFKYVLLAGVLATASSATIGVVTLSVTGYATWSDFGAIWSTWWLGDAGGALIVAPLLVLLWTRPELPWGSPSERRVELGLLGAAVVITGWAVFGGGTALSVSGYPIEFVTLPVLVWAAARSGPLGSAAIALVFSVFAVWGTLHGFGPFARENQNVSLLLVQTFMGVAAVTAMALAAAVLDRWRTGESLRAVEERLRLTDARERVERALSAAQAIAHLGSWELDVRTGEATWSDELYRILGLTPAQLRPSYDALLGRVHEDDRENVNSAVDETIIHGGSFELDCRFVRPDGEVRSIHSRGSAKADGTSASTRILATAHDVTELRIAQAAQVTLMREQVARAEAEAAIAAREEFLSVAAHELRTPVAGLLGHTQLAHRHIERHDAVDVAWLRARLETIERQVRRLGNLVDQLLDLATLQRGKLNIDLHESDLSLIVAGVVEQFRAVHPSVRLTVTAGVPVLVRVDALRIEQVLTNLIDNALKFGGNTKPTDVEVLCDANAAVVSVRDRGPGIPPGERQRVFERFHQAHIQRHFGGMGLGLYISREIVELHGGTIAAEEPEGGGTRFVVRLPRVEAPDTVAVATTHG
jgi:signal transduction histidine kinase